MNETDIKKPILGITDLLSIMEKNVPLMKEDESYTMSIAIGPDFDKEEVNKSYDLFHGLPDMHTESIRESIRQDTDANVFGYDEDLEEVLKHAKELPENVKIYSVKYTTAISEVTFDFADKAPMYTVKSPEGYTNNSFGYVTDPILNDIEDKYQAVDMY